MSKTKFQIKQQIIQQLNLSLNWSKNAINENYRTLSDDSIMELTRIRTEIKHLIQNIDINESEVLQ